MGNYVDTYTPKFKEQLLKQKPEFVALVKAKIADLRADPYHNTELMKGQHRGKRKAWLNDSDRIAFVICEECEHEGFTNITNVAIVGRPQKTRLLLLI